MEPLCAFSFKALKVKDLETGGKKERKLHVKLLDSDARKTCAVFARDFNTSQILIIFGNCFITSLLTQLIAFIL